MRKQVWSLWCIFIPVPNHPPSTQPFHLKRTEPLPKIIPPLPEVPMKKGPKPQNVFHFQGSQDSKPPRGPQTTGPHSPMVNFCFVVTRWPRNRRWRLRNWLAWQPCRWASMYLWRLGCFSFTKKTQHNTTRLLVWNTFVGLRWKNKKWDW